MSLSKPSLRIAVQPNEEIKFCYSTEHKSKEEVGTPIFGEHSSINHRTYPAVEITNGVGPAIINVTCVCNDDSTPPKKHPNKLVGEGCKDGICTLYIGKGESRVSMRNVKLQRVTKKIAEAENFKAEQYDFHSFKLFFDAIIEVAGPTVHRATVTTLPIYDKAANHFLTMTRVSPICGTAAGGDEVTILCERVRADNIEVVFAEYGNDPTKWEKNAVWVDNEPLVHKQFAIVVKSPKFREIGKPIKVKIALRTKQHPITMSKYPVEWTYLPNEILKCKANVTYDDPEGIERKRKKSLLGIVPNCVRSSMTLQEARSKVENCGDCRKQVDNTTIVTFKQSDLDYLSAHGSRDIDDGDALTTFYNENVPSAATANCTAAVPHETDPDRGLELTSQSDSCWPPSCIPLMTLQRNQQNQDVLLNSLNLSRPGNTLQLPPSVVHPQPQFSQLQMQETSADEQSTGLPAHVDNLTTSHGNVPPEHCGTLALTSVGFLASPNYSIALAPNGTSLRNPAPSLRGDSSGDSNHTAFPPVLNSIGFQNSQPIYFVPSATPGNSASLAPVNPTPSTTTIYSTNLRTVPTNGNQIGEPSTRFFNPSIENDLNSASAPNGDGSDGAVEGNGAELNRDESLDDLMKIIFGDQT